MSGGAASNGAAERKLPGKVSCPQPAPKKEERQGDSAARGYHGQRSGDDVGKTTCSER